MKKLIKTLAVCFACGLTAIILFACNKNNTNADTSEPIQEQITETPSENQRNIIDEPIEELIEETTEDSPEEPTQAPTFCTEHHLGQWEIITISTCTTEGEKRRCCSNCTYYETETLPLAAHVYNTDEITTIPTCHQKGIRTYYCQNCDKTKTEELPLDPDNHDLVYQTTPASCTEPGTRTESCRNCDYSHTETIDPLGHVFDEETHCCQRCQTYEAPIFNLVGSNWYLKNKNNWNMRSGGYVVYFETYNPETHEGNCYTCSGHMTNGQLVNDGPDGLYQGTYHLQIVTENGVTKYYIRFADTYSQAKSKYYGLQYSEEEVDGITYYTLKDTGYLFDEYYGKDCVLVFAGYEVE